MEEVKINEEGLPKSRKEVRKEKKLEKRNAKTEKLKNRFFSETDIKFRGPLSYRHLRIIAWIAIAVMVFVKINDISAVFLENKVMNNEALEYILDFLSQTSIPLFIIATFSTLFNNSKSFKKMIIFYGVAYVLVAIIIIIVYQHYVVNVLNVLDISAEAKNSVKIGLANHVQVNVFADLFALSIFNFCMNYTPKKIFLGKKKRLFRMIGFIPILIAVLGYIIKVGESLKVIDAPFSLCVFLPTKPPLIYALFIIVTIWIKLREKKFYKLGGTKEGYIKYAKSNRGSLDFSITFSVTLAIISIIDFVLLMVTLLSLNVGLLFFSVFLDIGDCSLLIFSIPVVMLFSYTKIYDDTGTDLMISMGGVGLVAITIVETVYRIIVAVFSA